MIERGGERKDPRVEALKEFVRWDDRNHLEELPRGLAVLLDRGRDALADAASSVPVGGAPRDDQNDDVETLAEARGFTDEQPVLSELARTLASRLRGLASPQVTHGPTPRLATVERATFLRLADAAAELSRAVLAARVAIDQTRDDRSEYPNPSSGAAPKGEQGRITFDGTPLHELLPPSDRLTPEELRAAIDALEAALDVSDLAEGPFPAWESALAKLKAHLADREPE